MNTRPRFSLIPSLSLLGGLLLATPLAQANGEHADAHAAPAPTRAAPMAAQAAHEPAPATLADRVRAAVANHQSGRLKQVSLVVNPAEEAHAPARTSKRVAAADHGGHGASPSSASREYIRAKAAALAGHEAPAAGGHAAHWEYDGDTGPAHWGELKPEFNACATGKRQSPIHIVAGDAVPGPAEPIEFHYGPSGGSVVNNGHTIQVDPMGHNWIKVRGSAYKLVQFHFHHPAEEKVNYKGFAMVAHLVHKNEAGQLAVVAVLLDVGPENPFLEKIWTHMPLEVQDRVGLPDELINLTELLPKDQRYYQFMGSLTTPPCTEGVLWMVVKQPVSVGLSQLRLFTKLFPMNARPVQAVNGRLVREGT